MTALPQIAGVHSAAQSYAGLVLSMKPLGFWPLDEASGTNARDISGNGLDGTYVNAPTLHDRRTRPPRQLGDSRSPDFNGTNEYVDLDARVASFNNLAACSVVLQHVNDSNSDFATVFSISDPTPVTDYWIFSIDASRALFWVADGGNKIFARTVGTMTVGAENFMAVAADGSGNNVRFNGAAVPYPIGGTGTAGGTDQVLNMSRMRIANVNRNGDSDVNHWDGPVWNVAFFDSRLSVSQLEALYLASLYGT